GHWEELRKYFQCRRIRAPVIKHSEHSWNTDSATLDRVQEFVQLAGLIMRDDLSEIEIRRIDLFEHVLNLLQAAMWIRPPPQHQPWRPLPDQRTQFVGMFHTPGNSVGFIAAEDDERRKTEVESAIRKIQAVFEGVLRGQNRNDLRTMRFRS